MANFILTKIMVLLLVVNLALASAPTPAPAPMPEHPSPRFLIAIHSHMDTSRVLNKVKIHPRTSVKDYGELQLDPRFSDFFGTDPHHDMDCEFKWVDHGETSGRIFSFRRDANRCGKYDAVIGARPCYWNVTTKGVLGINSVTGNSDILFKWKNHTMIN